MEDSFKRITSRDYFNRPYVPGYAPMCGDKETCELLAKLVDVVCDMEDREEKEGLTHESSCYGRWNNG